MTDASSRLAPRCGRGMLMIPRNLLPRSGLPPVRRPFEVRRRDARSPSVVQSRIAASDSRHRMDLDPPGPPNPGPSAPRMRLRGRTVLPLERFGFRLGSSRRTATAGMSAPAGAGSRSARWFGTTRRASRDTCGCTIPWPITRAAAAAASAMSWCRGSSSVRPCLAPWPPRVPRAAAASTGRPAGQRGTLLRARRRGSPSAAAISPSSSSAWIATPPSSRRCSTRHTTR